MSEDTVTETPAVSIDSLWSLVKTTVDSAENDSKVFAENATAALRFRKALRAVSKASAQCSREVLKVDKARRLEKKKSKTSRVRVEASKALSKKSFVRY